MKQGNISKAAKILATFNVYVLDIVLGTQLALSIMRGKCENDGFHSIVLLYFELF